MEGNKEASPDLSQFDLLSSMEVTLVPGSDPNTPKMKAIYERLDEERRDWAKKIAENPDDQLFATTDKQ